MTRTFCNRCGHELRQEDGGEFVKRDGRFSVLVQGRTDGAPDTQLCGGCLVAIAMSGEVSTRRDARPSREEGQ